MTFPRYPKYKDSGVEWLGKVPEHWVVKRIGSLFRQVDEPGDESLQILSVSIHDGVSDKELDEKEMDRKVTRSDDRTKYKAVQPGDLVYNMMRAWQGGFGTVAVAGMVSPAYVVARPVTKYMTLYIERLLRTPHAIEQMRRYSKGVTDFRLRLYWEEFKTISVVLPDAEEQLMISEFLDREMAKIDELVTEQRRLIELLKEKRQAVISHAVTKGLNPHAPLKPSGIEWLGDMPEHWELKRLKYLGKSIIGLTYNPAEIVDEGLGTLVLRSSNIQGGKIVFDDNVFVSTTIPEDLITQLGDILICSRNGSRALIGKNALIDESSAGLTFGAFMTVFRSSHSSYLACVLNSPLFEFQSGAFLTSTINQLTSGVLNNFEVPFPPEDERDQIALYLEREITRFDALVAEAQRAIDLLQERRTALISAAVTGQIDVRRLEGAHERG
ncbi:MAG TPA: restriction endonuclease subunit S [Candidatus Ozemobacteraceae bacterium]|nr:restriction endonuclease subunit S [Candidatus Ozemobacteraceae bacterium]